MRSVTEKPKKNIFLVVCISLFVAVVLFFVYSGYDFGNQAMNAMYLSAEFQGDYKIADGEWHPYVKGEHIPANEGDVTLKGEFNLVFPTTGEVMEGVPEGVTLAFYFNHISASISEDGGEFYTFDAEMDGLGEDMCGHMYIGYSYNGGKEVTLVLRNPHKFGNNFAVDDFLDNLNTYGGINFEKDMMARGNIHRMWGIILILFAFMILGTAIFSTLIRIKSSANMWIVGSCIFFAGVYFIFKAHGVMFFSEIIKFNTRTLVASMMLYMLAITAFIAAQLRDRAKLIARMIVILLLVTITVFMLLPSFADIKFYDITPVWVGIQGVACIFMMVLLGIRVFKGGRTEKLFSVFGMLPMGAFVIDAMGEILSLWRTGAVSEIVFVLIFIASLVFLLRIIPDNLNAAMRAKELEVERAVLNAELSESRISTMISQIQPHFIYNTLGTIEQLCTTEPEMASKLVRNFAFYLRGNFSELDSVKPIRFSQEMNHVKHYTYIEQVRFPDITIQYDLRSVEFLLPALSVQPLVENAIKHGIMGLEEGGVVTVSAYETDKHYVVEVTDDGVGFDVNAVSDETKRVGIKNIRGRIEAMCNGTLEIESAIGVGTKATLKIPKEATE